MKLPNWATPEQKKRFIENQTAKEAIFSGSRGGREKQENFFSYICRIEGLLMQAVHIDSELNSCA